MKKTAMKNRILSGILALVMLISLLPVLTWSAEPETEQTASVTESAPLRITCEGEETDLIRLAAHDRIEINAENGGVDAAHQWQILHPEKENVWINIYDATHGYLFVTLALVRNMLNEDDIAQLRCRVTDGEQVRYTDPVTVQFCQELEFSPTPTATEPPEVEVEPELPEKTTESTVPETTEPEETTAPAETEATEPEETTAPAETEATEPEETTAPAETEATEPEETTAPAETEATEPGETTAPAETEATEPEETTAPAETEATEPGETTAPAETEATEPGETTAPEESQAFAVMEIRSFMAERPAEEMQEQQLAVAAEEPDPAQTGETEATEPAETATPEAEQYAVALADEEPVDPETAEFVKITIEYIRYDFARDEDNMLIPDTTNSFGYQLEEEGSVVFNPYVATIQYDGNLSTSVHIPTVVGYTATEGETKTGFTMTADGNVAVSLTGVQEDVTYQVAYVPSQVNYTVRYYFQNIYDDQYVENTAMKIQWKGYTSGMPEGRHLHPTPDSLQKTDYPYMEQAAFNKLIEELNGFLPLYYQPDSIAADGSTVFEVYLERNYYLMEFNCDGGYGAETLYNRYGSYINVPSPTKAGWVFAGWDLSGTEDDNGNPGVTDTTVQQLKPYANTLPTSMPAKNTAYIALWGTDETTYTVAYWITNADGTKSYLGSLQKTANSGDYVNGSGDLTATTVLCGYPDHTHTEDCYDCDHKHGAGCDPGWSTHVSEPGEHKMPAMQALGQGEPEEGYLYLVQRPDNGKDYYMKFGDKWYGWSKYDYETESGEGALLKSATITYNGQEYTAYKYRFSGTLPCGHNHANDRLICNAHKHSSDCYVDDFVHMQYIDGDDHVLVQGDGSTVVNVYYEYKTYRLKFYYAAANGDTRNATNVAYRIVGGSTYYFGGQHDIGSYNTYINSSTFKMLDVMFDTGDHQTGLVASGKTPSLKESVVNANIYDIGCDYDKASGRTYYYISFTARFNDVIADKWPADVFDSVEMASGYNTTAGSWKDKSLATVSAWNGEHHVWYSRHVANETIKGKYEKLDYKIVYDSELYTTYPESTDSDGKNPLPTISYLCFWENGATRDWNVPELYRYNIYLEALPNTPVSNTDIIKQRVNSQGETEYIRYYLKETYNTCDNSFVNTQTQTSLEGFDNTVRYTAGSTVKKNADGTYEVITPEPYLYATYEYQELEKGTDYSGDQYNEGYSVNFYYDRIHYKLNFVNHDRPLLDIGGSDVAYGTNLAGHGNYVSVDKMNNAGIVNPATGKTFDPYPPNLEPGAYECTGWYTSSNFNLEDTKITDWSSMTMPASNMTVYARWEPVKRDVLFFTYYDDIAALEAAYASPDGAGNGITNYIAGRKKTGEGAITAKPDQIPYAEAFDSPHGETLESRNVTYPDYTEDNRIPTRVNENGETVNRDTFIGWFYFDDDGKKRFAPDTMEITSDLLLFAEWQSAVDTTYKVEYVLQENVTIGENTYAAGTPIADTIEAHASVGKTKTFNAKGTKELYDTFRKNIFPVNNSHSILMQENSADNAYQFEYVYDEKVFYLVQYVDRITGKRLVEDVKIVGTDEAVVTEKFRPIPDYIPEKYYITKALASDDDFNGGIANPTEEEIDPQNIITFYYNPDDEHGIYSIEYYLESGTDENGAIIYTQYESIVGTDNLNATKTAEIRSYEGYAYQEDLSRVITYEDDGTAKPPVAGISGPVTNKGLTIKLYYNRNPYPYIVEYREYGKPGADPLKTISVVGDTTQWLKFDTEFTYTLDDDGDFNETGNTIQFNGKTYEYVHGVTGDPESDAYKEEVAAARSKTITIRADEDGNDNRIIFYFTQKQVQIFYHEICTIPVIRTNFGVVSPNMEAADNIAGSAATPANGFRFVGWYREKDGQQVLIDPETEEDWFAKDTGNNLKPNHLKPPEKIEPEDKETGLWENHYYALFEPVEKSLIINKAGENLDSEDTFLFNITGTDVTGRIIDLTVSVHGAGFVTINGLYCGEYTVTELTSWSWAYANTGDDSQIVKMTTIPAEGETAAPDSYTVTFTNRKKTEEEYKWCHGEGSKDNIFTGVTPPETSD